jgi:hypothetical protein
MSDIDLLPGIGLLLVSVWLVLGSALLMLVFLLVGKWSQRNRPFPRRWAASLMRGMLLAFVLGWIGVAVANFGPRSWVVSLDRVPIPTVFAITLFPFLLGAAWGLWRYKKISAS